MPAVAWGGRRCRWPRLLCDPQHRKQLITAVSASLHPLTSKWTTWKPLRFRRCSVSSVSVAVWLSACCCTASNSRYFQIKSPPLLKQAVWIHSWAPHKERGTNTSGWNRNSVALHWMSAEQHPSSPSSGLFLISLTIKNFMKSELLKSSVWNKEAIPLFFKEPWMIFL